MRKIPPSFTPLQPHRSKWVPKSQTEGRIGTNSLFLFACFYTPLTSKQQECTVFVYNQAVRHNRQ